MKRSDMCYYLESILINKINQLNLKMYPDVADYILTELELKGMMPPGIETDEIIFPNGTPEYKLIFDWEPEND